MSLDEFAASYLPRVDSYLADLLRREEEPVAAFFGMMRYHLGWADARLQPVGGSAGKRLRPLVCLLACRAAGGDPAQAVPAAAALELVHSFSLVHDDIEDGSRMRRGRPAVWDVWGVAQAINVGDGLFALAHLAALQLAEGGVPAGRTLAAARAVDEACLALCEGQYLDMSLEKRADVSAELYLSMIGLKTAALLAASAQVGAVVATEDAGTIARFHRFGRNLGLAFQIQDDVLGTWGEEGITGKSASTDLRDKKKTLPLVHAITAHAGSDDGERLAMLLKRPNPLDDGECREMLAILERAGARQYAEGEAARYLDLALESLGGECPPETGEALLADLARSLLRRRA